MVHNPETGFFEVKRSPPSSPTVSPVRRLYDTTHVIKQSSYLTRNVPKPKHSINTETPHTTSSTLPRSSQITDNTYPKDSTKTSQIT